MLPLAASGMTGEKMDVRAAVAHKAGEPLVVETVRLDGPKAGEVLVEIKATGICHTDEFTRSGADPEGLFPAILGHEGAGIVVDVGPGVTTLKRATTSFRSTSRMPRVQVVPVAQDQPLHVDSARHRARA
jgi:NADPH:quinone reductase-like Zn-dependent oxidoreductase